MKVEAQYEVWKWCKRKVLPANPESFRGQGRSKGCLLVARMRLSKARRSSLPLPGRSAL